MLESRHRQAEYMRQELKRKPSYPQPPANRVEDVKPRALRRYLVRLALINHAPQHIGLGGIRRLLYPPAHLGLALGAYLRVYLLEPLPELVVLPFPLGIVRRIGVVGEVLREGGCKEPLVVEAGVAEYAARRLRRRECSRHSIGHLRGGACSDGRGRRVGDVSILLEVSFHTALRNMLYSRPTWSR